MRPLHRALNFKFNTVPKKFHPYFLPALAFVLAFVSLPAVAQTADGGDAAIEAADRPPTLSELILLAEEYHADFLAQEFNLQAERENENISFAAFMPQLSSQWSDDNNQRSFSRDWLLRFSLSLPLLDIKAWENWRASQERVRFAEINFDLARQTLRRDVIVAWFNTQLAADVLNINETRQKTLREQAARAELLAAAGKTTNTDVLSARASLANAKAQWQQARHNLAIAQDAIIRYTGETVATARLNVDSPPPPQPLSQWQHEISQNNLSIAAMEQQIKFLRRQLKSIGSEYMPRIALSATHDLRGGMDNDQSVIGFSIAQPLFTGGRLSAQKRQALAQLEAAYKSLTDVRRAQQQTVRRLHGQIQSDLASIEALQEAVETAEALLESVILGYNSGVRIATEVLSAEEDVFNARLELRQAAYRHLQNTVELQTLAAATDETFTTEISTLFSAEQ